MKKIQLYLLLLLACLAGYIWLFWLLYYSQSVDSVSLCPIKQVTSIPCPSCGSSRGVVAILHGNLLEALRLNPVSYIIAGVMLVSPIWIIGDIILRKKSLYSFYIALEQTLKKPQYYIPLLILVLINWVWNIFKDL